MKIIQISDTHLFGSTAETSWDISTLETFKKVLSKIKKEEEEIDAVIVTGDIAHHGEVAAYEIFIREMNDLNTAVYFVPGNHDDKKTLLRMLSGEKIKKEGSFLLGQWHIILLDSCLPGLIEGKLSKQELDRLEEACFNYPEYHTMVVLHHHLKMGWVEEYALQNSEDFLSVLRRFPHVKIILCGHVHLELTKKIGEMMLLAPPSTSIQFKPIDSKLVEVDDQAPGYRWIKLLNNGDFMTSVVRVSC